MTRCGMWIAALVAATASAAAAPKACAPSETRVQGYGCVATSVVRQATKNCAAVAAAVKHPVSFTECLCADGPSVGACGD